MFLALSILNDVACLLVSTPCDTNNGNCEQLCLLGAGRTATCACVQGYTLAGDGRTCGKNIMLLFYNYFAYVCTSCTYIIGPTYYVVLGTR